MHGFKNRMQLSYTNTRNMQYYVYGFRIRMSGGDFECLDRICFGGKTRSVDRLIIRK